MTTTPETTRLALLADVAAGMSPRSAARKHGVGESTAYRWIRGRIDWRAAEFAYAGSSEFAPSAWELRRGVLRPLFPEQRSA